jgi:WD40 repeat protein
LWDTATGAETAQWDEKLNIVHCAQWLPRLGVVAQGGEDLMLRLWDVRANAPFVATHTLGGFDYHPICCDGFGASSTAGTACSDEDDAATSPSVGGEHELLTGHNGFNGTGCMLQLWDLRKPGIAAVWRAGGHAGTIRCVRALPQLMAEHMQAAAALPELPVCASGGDDGALVLWGRSGAVLANVALGIGAITSVACADGAGAGGQVVVASRLGDVVGGAFVALPDGGVAFNVAWSCCA